MTRVLVVGAGVAGLEALLGLRHLGRGRLLPELVSTSSSSRLCPEIIGRPWGERPVEIDLDELCGELGVRRHAGQLVGVDQARRTVALADGGELGYDCLLVACGATAVDPYLGVRTVGSGPFDEQFAALRPGRLSIVVPPGVSWTLPAYQLALLAATERGLPVEVITPERRPLEFFGERAPALVTRLLSNAGVRVLPRCVVPPGSDLFAMLDNVMALPTTRGPAILGLPDEGSGFLPVDGMGRVIGAARVHAAGNVTSRRLKQAGLAAHDGEVAATDIVRSAGAELAAHPAARVLCGRLVAADGRTVYLRRALDGHDPGAASEEPLPRSSAAPSASRLAHWLRNRGAVYEPSSRP